MSISDCVRNNFGYEDEADFEYQKAKSDVETLKDINGNKFPRFEFLICKCCNGTHRHGLLKNVWD